MNRPAPVPLHDLSRPWKSLEKEVLAELKEVFREGDFVLGKRVAALEAEVAAYCRAPHGVACASGSDAIRLALRGLGVGPGHEVVTTPFTFFATAGAIWHAGARPVFADIDPVTLNLDPRAAQAAVTSRTKALLPVHLFGRCADMAAFLQIAGGRRLALVEDMAQAIGAEVRGLRAGSLGDAAALSFYPSKNLGGAGDGGMVLTSYPRLEQTLRRARNHGQSRRYEHDSVGTNSRLDGVQAAVLRAKLKRLDGWIEARGANAARYDAMFRGLSGVRTPAPVPAAEGRHVYHQYTLRCDRRDALRSHLEKEGIGTAVHYPLPLHLQRAFASLGGRLGQFPEAEKASREVLSIPVFPELTEGEQERVVTAVRGFYGR